MFRMLGKFAVALATMAFLVAASLFLVGAYLLTWPVLRKSPRNAKIQAATNLGLAAFQALQVYGGQNLAAMLEGEDAE